MSKPPFRERLVFDGAKGAVFDETRRYMMLRPEALMGLFNRLAPEARQQALEAFGASIIELGRDSATAYLAHGGGDRDALLSTVATTAPDLGWGRWHFTKTGEDLTLTVHNSPFAAGFGRSDRPVCHAITGMLTSVASMHAGTAKQARETTCAACGAPACVFVAQ
jgi:uncharacterized protein